jgi:hypothetical protein
MRWLLPLSLLAALAFATARPASADPRRDLHHGCLPRHEAPAPANPDVNRDGRVSPFEQVQADRRARFFGHGDRDDAEK